MFVKILWNFGHEKGTTDLTVDEVFVRPDDSAHDRGRVGHKPLGTATFVLHLLGSYESSSETRSVARASRNSYQSDHEDELTGEEEHRSHKHTYRDSK